MKNRYLEILGLAPGASNSEIKSSFRKLAKQYHPDVNDSPEAKKKFIEIHEAYKFLTEVGPSPNHETVSYDFDPFEDAYETWRKQAQAYARQKAKEAVEEQRKLLFRLFGYFNYVAIVAVIINMIFLADFMLPEVRSEQQVVRVYKVFQKDSYGRVLYTHDDIVFDDFRFRVNKGSELDLADINKSEVLFTPFLHTLKSAELETSSELISIKPAYNLYKIFIYLIPLILGFSISYFALSRSNHNKLTLIIAICFALVYEMYLFIHFSAVNESVANLAS